MKEKIEKILKDERTSKSQIWITKEEFEILLPTFEQVELEERKKSEKSKKRAMWWWRKSVLSWIIEKLFFILYYLKVYPTYDEAWVLWWVHRSVIWDWVIKLFPILKESLNRLWVLPWETKEEFNKKLIWDKKQKYIFIDWSERQITRSTDYEKQKKFYSWKKSYIQ